MSSIVLGPWMSILAVSLALFVQAIFFGDGGITAFGANSFNMGIAGSLVAYGVYRAGSAGSGLTSVRRVVAAGLAGYVGINCAALLAAIEFGIQPLLFRDAFGVPLYAPYPLSVSIPAMMIGHLTIAGLAEFVVSAGLVRYLGRVDPALLNLNAPDVSASHLDGGLRSKTAVSRKLWLAVALAICLTPLGIMAVGKAWGEWSAQDFSDAAARLRIAAASRNRMPPEKTPEGLGRIASIWKAPLAGYEPSLIRSHSFAYFVCASAGVLVVIALATLITRFSGYKTAAGGSNGPKRGRRGFLDKTISGLLLGVGEALFAEEIARFDGLLQRMDPRVKLFGATTMIVTAVAIHRLTMLLVVFGLSVVVAAFSGISPALLAKRVWLPVATFTGVLVLPALFLVPGEVMARLPVLHWTVTVPGVMNASLLLLRAEVASSFSLLLILSTPWNRLLRALRFLKVPAPVVVVLQMTHRYVFLLLETAGNLFESRKARLVGRLTPSDGRHLAVATAGVLLDKTLHLGAEVHGAMQARGFRGDIYLLEDSNVRAADWTLLGTFVGIATLLIWLGQ